MFILIFTITKAFLLPQQQDFGRREPQDASTTQVAITLTTPLESNGNGILKFFQKLRILALEFSVHVDRIRLSVTDLLLTEVGMLSEVEVKVERGRRAPGHSLHAAIEMVEIVHGQLGSGPFARISIAESLGHSSENGASNRKIGSLTHYGLLDQSGGAYRLSELGQSICVPTSDSERSLAVAKAALEPAVYSDIYKQYAGKPLPRMLENLLQREFGIARGSSADCAKLFIESMEFAGFLRNGVLRSEPNDAGGDAVERIQQEPGHDAEKRSHAEPNSGPSRSFSAEKSFPSDGFQIPLSGNRVATLNLPRGINPADIKRICSWLELMEDVLTEECQKPVGADSFAASLT